MTTDERIVMAATVLSNFVGGQYVTARTDARIDVIDPATGLVWANSPDSSAADVAAGYQAAAGAFEAWRETTPSERQLALIRIADAIEARAEELADVEVRNTGKPRGLFLSEELAPAADQLRFFAGAARMLEGKASAEYLKDHTSSIRREPIGVIGQVTPWNYPFMMAVWKVAPAIAAGNTTVLKPSDTTPASSLLFAEIASEFLPAGVFNVITGGRDTGRAMTADRTPQMISITGSVRAGMEVAGSAALDLKRVHLELGGKAPVIVFADADIASAVEGISVAGFFNAGQDCTAATRVLVHASIKDEFVAALADYARVNALTGAADDESVLFGPVNSSAQLERVTGFIDRLPGHASLELGGHRQGDVGYFHEATIVSGLRQDDEIIQNEVFGPVITVQTFTDEAEALAMANGVPFGLASSVWTKDHSTALRMARRLDFGCVWINTHIPLVAEMPHGGFKHSGYGKDLSLYGFEDYTRIKHVMSYIG
ncbi:MAG: gamma-aminobutyraldehyde dehydrogenase [Microbacteriaceae bacterium]